MSLSFPSIWVPGSSFILASCLIGKEAISSILLDQCTVLGEEIDDKLSWNNINKVATSFRTSEVCCEVQKFTMKLNRRTKFGTFQ